MNIYTFDFDEIVESQEDFIVTSQTFGLAKDKVRDIRLTMGCVNEQCPAATT